jgi:tetratricopeptide (TPR) repeat protein
MYGAIKKIFFITAILAVSIVVYANNPQTQAQAFEIFKKGLASEKSLYIFEAKYDFRKALEIDGTNPGYLSHYAWFLHFYEFNEESIVAFDKALQYPQGPTSYFYKGIGWNAKVLGNLSESNAAYQHVYDSRWLKSNFTNAFIKTSWLIHYENAAKIRDLKKQLAKDPNNFNLQREQFNNYLNQGEFHNAVQLGKTLVVNSKIDNFTKLQYARALFADKNYTEAESQYLQLIQQFPRNAYLTYEWGTRLVKLHRNAEAYKMFSASISYYPSPEAKRALANLQAQQGNCKEALSTVQSMQFKNHVNYPLALGDVSRNCHQYQQATNYYQQVLQKDPYNTDALWGLLASTATSHNYTGNREAYDHWQEVYLENRSPLQNRQVNYYQSPQLALTGSYYDNAISFKRQAVGGAFDFYTTDDTRMSVAYNYTAFSEDGFDDVSRNMVALNGSKLFSEHWQLGGEISGKMYSNDYNNINGNVSLQYNWSPDLYLSVMYNHVDVIDTQAPFSSQIYNYVVSIGAVDLNVHTDDYSAYLFYQPTPKVVLWAKGIFGNYSDGNDRTEGDFEASYQLFDVPKVRILYDYFYLNFARPAPLFEQNGKIESAYYDPVDFQVHSAKLNIEHFFTQKLRAGVEGGLSYFPQNGSFANEVGAFIDYKVATHAEIKLDGHYYDQNESVGRFDYHGDPFWAKEVDLSFIWKM